MAAESHAQCATIHFASWQQRWLNHSQHTMQRHVTAFHSNATKANTETTQARASSVQNEGSSSGAESACLVAGGTEDGLFTVAQGSQADML